MRLRKLVILATVAALAAPLLAAAQQTVYRWIDKNGKVQFSDVPPNEDTKGLTQKDLNLDVGDTQLPYATQVAMRRNPVVLYTGRDCSDGCAKGRALLQKRGIPYSEKDAQGDGEAAEALKKRIDDLFIPSLAVGESTLKGFSESAWNTALDTAGYPSTLLPGQSVPKAPEAVKKGEPGTPQAAAAPEPIPELTTERR